MNAAVQNGFDSLAGFVQSQPDLNFRIPSGRGGSSWLLNTYLDKVARIAPTPCCVCAWQAAFHSLAASCPRTALVHQLAPQSLSLYV